MSSCIGMEEILGQLLVPDNTSIQQATLQIKAAFRDPNVIPELCRILGSSTNVQIRQYSAVLLRRKIQKRKIWKAIPQHVSQSIRDNILVILMAEPEKVVRKSISQLIGTMAKHDLSDNSWPQLFQFLVDKAQSADPLQREIAMFLLLTICSAADEQITPHMQSLMSLLTQALDDTVNILVPFYAIQAMSEIVYLASHEEAKLFQAVVPKVIAITKAFIQSDQKQACEVMEFFDEILEARTGIVNPHVTSLIDFCLTVAADMSLGDDIRVKALSFISAVTENKKLILKHKLVDPILRVIFPIICSGNDEDDNIDAEDEVEASTPPAYSAQVVDTMALHLPPEKIIPSVMKMIQPAFTSSNPQERRAAFLAMAVTAEGCADYITNKHMETVLELVIKGVEDPESVVRNAAMFALGQFSEHLQPKISEYAAQLLPLLYRKIGQSSQEMDSNPSGITKTYYALEMFCENLGKNILPYLPGLMGHLMSVLHMGTTPHIKELAISAIGATANAAKQNMQPYFPQVMTELEKYLSESVDEATMRLQIISIDTLSVFARSIGPETFLPLSAQCLQFAINLLQNNTDPDLKRCVYTLVAAVSSTTGSDMTQYLPVVVAHMLESLRSTEGVKTHYSKEKNPVKDIFNSLAEEEEEELGVDTTDDDDEEDDDDDDDEDEDDIKGISVENAYLDEKEDACNALGELALNTKGAFMPHVNECFQEVSIMLDYPTSDVKKAAMTAVTSFCCVVNEYNETNPSPDVAEAVTAMVDTVLPKLVETIKTDPDRESVCMAVDNVERLISELKTRALKDNQITEQIILCLKNIFNHELACQEQDEEGYDAGDNEAEFDGVLVESAGDVLPSIAKVIGGEMFLPVFTSTFLPLLIKKTKEQCSVSERSFSYGIIAEVIKSCGEAAGSLVDVVYPVFQRGLTDADAEARSNSIFGIGVLMSNCSSRYVSHYTEILRTLFTLLNSNESKPRVRDNICAAACRLIMANKASVPLHQTLAVIVQCLPLQEDFEENQTVFNCLLQLYATESQIVMKHLTPILRAVSHVLGSTEILEVFATLFMPDSTETEKMLIGFMQNLNSNYPSELKNTLTGLPQESVSKLNVCLATV